MQSVDHFDNDDNREELQAYKDILWHCHLTHMKPATLTVYANTLRMYAMCKPTQKTETLDRLLRQIRFHHPQEEVDHDDCDHETVADLLHMVRHLVTSMSEPQIQEYASVLDGIVVASLEEVTKRLELEEDDHEGTVRSSCAPDLSLGGHFLKVSVTTQDCQPGYDPSSDDSSSSMEQEEKDVQVVCSFPGRMCGVGRPLNACHPTTPPNTPKRATAIKPGTFKNFKTWNKLEPVMEGIELALNQEVLFASPAMNEPKNATGKHPKSPKINLELILKHSAFDETVSELSVSEDTTGTLKNDASRANEDSDPLCHGCIMQ
jgi:hypothetical protein